MSIFHILVDTGWMKFRYGCSSGLAIGWFYFYILIIFSVVIYMLVFIYFLQICRFVLIMLLCPVHLMLRLGWVASVSLIINILVELITVNRKKKFFNKYKVWFCVCFSEFVWTCFWCQIGWIGFMNGNGISSYTLLWSLKFEIESENWLDMHVSSNNIVPILSSVIMQFLYFVITFIFLFS